jgi:AcrR family transcriptional regulator
VKLKSSVGAKIIDRTIYLIGKKGTTKVPVREIAREAGVNVAAINYYFDSKEKMLAMVEERFIEAATEILDKLKDESVPPRRRLFDWCDEVMQYLMDYPGILLLIDRKMSEPAPDSFGLGLSRIFETGFQNLQRLLGQLVETDDEEALSFKVTMIISAIATPSAMFSGSLFQKESLRDETNRHRFLNLLVDLLLK